MPREHSIFFDAKDYELLAVVNRFIERHNRIPQEEEQSFLHSALHPHGIKELAISQEIRVAYSVINLLDSLEAGQMQDRISALRALHNEVLSPATSSFRYNTGRVLIQIMKNLIRAYGNTELQLRLAHDFREAATGKRRFIRKMLRRYYLLEMPEQWNQIAFDNHVHDANTKGRKSPTHLIMDAWIKGMRKLDVVYYNFVETGAISELLQAADIMNIRVRVGIEFQAQFRSRLVQFIWQPRGFKDWRETVAFFEEAPMQHLMRIGREASLFHHNYVLRLLEQYNARLRHELGQELGLSLSEIPESEILSFVGVGQMSRTHLAELMYRRIRSAFAEAEPALREGYAASGPAEKEAMRAWLEKLNAVSPEAIFSDWLNKKKNPDVPVPSDPRERDRLPEIMRLLPTTLIDWLTSIRSHCHITLNVSSLTVEDVLELLYECDGMISHLELYNLKNYEDGKMMDIEAISDLQTAINEGSAVALKRLIRNLIRESDCGGSSSTDERCELFWKILRNISKLKDFYSSRPLATRIGSDSTGRSSKVHGMGFAFLETLPARARKTLREKDSQRRNIPLVQDLHAQVIYSSQRHLPLGETLAGYIRQLPGCKYFGMRKREQWKVDEKTARYSSSASSITTLGGYQRDDRLPLRLEGGSKPQSAPRGFFYMNTSLKNACKVLFGFALTLVTFIYTQSWWVLAWLGPFLWFGITGFRNIAQSILGGGGVRRTPLLRWNDYVSWSRLCDSLMYTGISVPLLEYGVRVLSLEKGLGVDSLDSPVLVYTVMAIVNAVYIAGHNLFRGLPQEAIVGNLFRSVFAVPLSIVYNYAALFLFGWIGWSAVYVTQSAALLSKLASDTVAAVIEGFADRAEYLRMRHRDYKEKLRQLLDCYARLEVILPEEDVLELLRRPKDFMKTVGDEAKDLEKVIIVNALDLMFFWMYQPRARSTLARMLEGMSREEREVLVYTQHVLTRVHEVSQMLVDGLVGMNFARVLAFYLARYEEYLKDMGKLTGISMQQAASSLQEV